jgi:Protein of unknown function (DUF3891)
MILRPQEPASTGNTEVLPAWSVIERVQRASYDACWMITQPSHAALAGDFAARMAGPQPPKVDASVVRAIALHDAGWGVPDAQAIMRSRSVSQGCPKSFVACSVREFMEAWEKSIEVAASAGPAGGYIVSRHFTRIAEQSAAKLPEDERAVAARFLKSELGRQKQLAGKQERSQEELELLTDVLQFCDLLSLYICCGARERVVFPEYFGVKARLTVEAEDYRLDPPLIELGTEFKVAALRHPVAKSESGKEIGFSII